jgi:hypothetical protein
MVITRVAPISFAKITAVLYALLGLIFGTIVSLVSLAGGFASSSSRGTGLGLMVGGGAIVILPLLYGTIGFIATLIGAWLYNIAAGLVGGVEMDVQ